MINPDTFEDVLKYMKETPQPQQNVEDLKLSNAKIIPLDSSQTETKREEILKNIKNILNKMNEYTLEKKEPSYPSYSKEKTGYQKYEKER